MSDLRADIAQMIAAEDETAGGWVGLRQLALAEEILGRVRARLEPMRPDPPGGPTSYGRGRIEMLDQVLEALTWSEPVRCEECLGSGLIADAEDTDWCGDPEHCSPRSIPCPDCGGIGKVYPEPVG